MNLEREIESACSYFRQRRSPDEDLAFTDATFVEALAAKAGLQQHIDRRYVRVILSGRPDVEVLQGAQILVWHSGWLARLRWWLNSTSCTANCGWRVRQHNGTRENAYCHFCLRDMGDTGRAIARY